MTTKAERSYFFLSKKNPSANSISSRSPQQNRTSALLSTSGTIPVSSAAPLSPPAQVAALNLTALANAKGAANNNNNNSAGASTSSNSLGNSASRIPPLHTGPLQPQKRVSKQTFAK